MARDAREKLVEWLIGEAFEPVMRAKAQGRSDKDRATIERLQRATQAEIDRFRTYPSAEDVVVNFKRDLHSTPAKAVHAELRALGLPVITDLRDAFEQKARNLGIEAG